MELLIYIMMKLEKGKIVLFILIICTSFLLGYLAGYYEPSEHVWYSFHYKGKSERKNTEAEGRIILGYLGGIKNGKDLEKIDAYISNVLGYDPNDKLFVVNWKKLNDND